jgi:hypothetical protein
MDRLPKITGGKVMSGKTKRCANRAAQALADSLVHFFHGKGFGVGWQQSKRSMNPVLPPER